MFAKIWSRCRSAKRSRTTPDIPNPSHVPPRSTSNVLVNTSPLTSQGSLRPATPQVPRTVDAEEPVLSYSSVDPGSTYQDAQPLTEHAEIVSSSPAELGGDESTQTKGIASPETHQENLNVLSTPNPVNGIHGIRHSIQIPYVEDKTSPNPIATESSDSEISSQSYRPKFTTKPRSHLSPMRKRHLRSRSLPQSSKSESTGAPMFINVISPSDGEPSNLSPHRQSRGSSARLSVNWRASQVVSSFGSSPSTSEPQHGQYFDDLSLTVLSEDKKTVIAFFKARRDTENRTGAALIRSSVAERFGWPEKTRSKPTDKNKEVQGVTGDKFPVLDTIVFRVEMHNPERRAFKICAYVVDDTYVPGTDCLLDVKLIKRLGLLAEPGPKMSANE